MGPGPGGIGLSRCGPHRHRCGPHQLPQRGPGGLPAPSRPRDPPPRPGPAGGADQPWSGRGGCRGLRERGVPAGGAGRRVREPPRPRPVPEPAPAPRGHVDDPACGGRRQGRARVAARVQRALGALAGPADAVGGGPARRRPSPSRHAAGGVGVDAAPPRGRERRGGGGHRAHHVGAPSPWPPPGGRVRSWPAAWG